MTRNIHDTFAKEWMQELLADFGQVEIESPVVAEVRTVDLYFQPDCAALATLPALGTLGRILASACILEPFRNPVPVREIRNCLGKLFDLEAAYLRRAKQEKRTLSPSAVPLLWIFSPTVSARIQQGFGMSQQASWGEGIYFLPLQMRTAVVALHQLPKTRDTLWLRLLGRGTVQAAAIAEILALPADHPYKQQTLKHLAVLQVNLRARQNLNRDFQEVVMSLSPIYEQWRQATLAEGEQLGERRGEQRAEQRQRSLIFRLLTRKVGPIPEDVRSHLEALPLEQLETLGEALLEFTAIADLTIWLETQSK